MTNNKILGLRVKLKQKTNFPLLMLLSKENGRLCIAVYRKPTFTVLQKLFKFLTLEIQKMLLINRAFNRYSIWIRFDHEIKA